MTQTSLDNDAELAIPIERPFAADDDFS